MTLSAKAWALSEEIYNKILKHPFNQELMTGDLCKEKFGYYIEQDSLYLHDFARCHAIISSKITLELARTFLKYAEHTFIVEQEVVHQYFKKLFDIQEKNEITLATLSYTSYLLRVCLHEPIELAVAAILPCFWIYREVGLFIATHSSKTNPYSRWIETYCSEEFSTSVDEVISIFDKLAQNTTEDIRKKMLEAFYKSTCLEWHFWNDAYNMKGFNCIESNEFTDQYGARDKTIAILEPILE